jgi:phage gp46-like protein
MTDVALTQINDGDEWDVVLEDGDLVGDDSLETAILVSLLTDAEDATLSTGERRGWWGDTFNDDPADRIGSHLWLLRREKQTDATLARAIDYAREALGFLIDDGVASNVTVTGEWAAPGFLRLQVAVESQFLPPGKSVSVSVLIKLLFANNVVITL